MANQNFHSFTEQDIIDMIPYHEEYSLFETPDNKITIKLGAYLWAIAKAFVRLAQEKRSGELTMFTGSPIVPEVNETVGIVYPDIKISDTMAVLFSDALIGNAALYLVTLNSVLRGSDKVDTADWCQCTSNDLIRIAFEKLEAQMENAGEEPLDNCKLQLLGESSPVPRNLSKIAKKIYSAVQNKKTKPKKGKVKTTVPFAEVQTDKFKDYRDAPQSNEDSTSGEDLSNMVKGLNLDSPRESVSPPPINTATVKPPSSFQSGSTSKDPENQDIILKKVMAVQEGVMKNLTQCTKLNDSTMKLMSSLHQTLTDIEENKEIIEGHLNGATYQESECYKIESARIKECIPYLPEYLSMLNPTFFIRKAFDLSGPYGPFIGTSPDASLAERSVVLVQLFHNYILSGILESGNYTHAPHIPVVKDTMKIIRTVVDETMRNLSIPKDLGIKLEKVLDEKQKERTLAASQATSSKTLEIESAMIKDQRAMAILQSQDVDSPPAAKSSGSGTVQPSGNGQGVGKVQPFRRNLNYKQV